ncbi:unnamed protein product, partial [Closterium sp. Naga37s-1]
MYFPPFGGMGQPLGSFEQSFHVYPVSFIDKAHLENGDKVIMPPSALDRLASLHIDYPMLFEVHNAAANRTSHCGVLEFIAEEGYVYMPYWMMQNLLLQEGDIVRFRNATLPKGTYVKLQPHTKDFLDISNPKAVLEMTLRSFSCLTKGESIMVAYNNKRYFIDVVDARPAAAISIIETDCEVDFAPPLDYVEPERVPTPVKAPAAAAAAAGGSEAGGKKGAGKDGKAEAAPPPEEPAFTPFVGTGRRLDGRPAASPSSPATSAAATSAASREGVSGAGGASGARSSGGGAGSSSAGGAAGAAGAASGGRKEGRLVFGSGDGAPRAGPKGKAVLIVGGSSGIGLCMGELVVLSFACGTPSLLRLPRAYPIPSHTPQGKTVLIVGGSSGIGGKAVLIVGGSSSIGLCMGELALPSFACGAPSLLRLPRAYPIPSHTPQGKAVLIVGGGWVERHWAGKAVLIVGGSSGIGLCMGELAVRQGARVAIVARNKERLASAHKQLEALLPPDTPSSDFLLSVAADAANPDDAKRAVDQVVAAFGRLDVVICCQGQSTPHQFEFDTVENQQQLMNVNYWASVYVIRAALPAVKRAGKEGRIMLVSSQAGQVGIYSYTAYSAAKFALRGLAEALQMELEHVGTRVVMLFPPDTDTPQLQQENETKPAVTKAITAGNKPFPPMAVARAAISAVERGDFLAPVGFDGWMLSIATAASPPQVSESAAAALVAYFCPSGISLCFCSPSPPLPSTYHPRPFLSIPIFSFAAAIPQPAPPEAEKKQPISDLVWPAVGAFVSFAGFALADHLLQSHGLTVSLGSFGAVCCLLFAAPQAAVSQRKTILIAHVGTALIGVALFCLLGPSWLAKATAVAASIAFMQFTNSVHPPAAGLPLIFLDAPKFHRLKWWYPLFPGLVGCLWLFLV